MKRFWQAVYNCIALPSLYLFFRVSALFDEKVREGITGREGLFESLEEQLARARNLPKTIWFHFTSVGEFEQAKPLIAELKDEARIVLTYFSPSVHPNVQKYVGADVRCYLPFDTLHNAERLMNLIQPNILVFSKFDIWPHLVWIASKHDVRIALIAGTLHAKSKRLLPIALSFFRAVYEDIDVFCAISKSDAQRFRKICPKDARIYVTGDTRFDRVYQRAKSISIDEEFIPGQQSLPKPIIVAGSTYLEDERVLLEAYKLLRERLVSSAPRLILVPHEPTQERISEIDLQLSQTSFVSKYLSSLRPNADLSGVDVLVIDALGLLAKLYLLGDITFVGGSFRGSVHNVMEPAAMQKPVIFGPTIHNSYEAMLLQNRNAGILVNDAQEMARAFYDLLTNPDEIGKLGCIAEGVIAENLGAAEKTLDYIKAQLS